MVNHLGTKLVELAASLEPLDCGERTACSDRVTLAQERSAERAMSPDALRIVAHGCSQHLHRSATIAADAATVVFLLMINAPPTMPSVAVLRPASPSTARRIAASRAGVQTVTAALFLGDEKTTCRFLIAFGILWEQTPSICGRSGGR